MRVIKEHEERKTEIMDTAETLFLTNGYGRTTINDILNKVGIAKGTFYYYFKSKEEIMNAIVDRYMDAGVEAARAIVADPSLGVYDKIFMVLMAQKMDTEENQKMIEQFHEVENAQIHQRTLTEGVIKLTPVLTEVVEQGIAEGLMSTPYPRELMEMIFVTSVNLFDEGLFHWTEEEKARKVEAQIYFLECLLGTGRGALACLTPAFQSKHGDKHSDQAE